MTDPSDKDIIAGLKEVLLESDIRFSLRHTKHIVTAISLIERYKWVPIDEIPPEWKDGRALDVCSRFTEEWIGDPSLTDSVGRLKRVQFERHANDRWQIKICYKDGQLVGSLPVEFDEYMRDSDGEMVPKDEADWHRSKRITHVRPAPALPKLEA